MIAEFKIDSRKLEQVLIQAPKLFQHNVTVEVRKTFSRFRRRAIRESGIKQKREGLQKRWFWRVRGRGADVMGEFFSPSTVAALHERGGTIRARAGAFLAVPAGFAVTGTGVAKKRYRNAGKLIGAERAKFRFFKDGNRVLVFEIVGRLRANQKKNFKAGLEGKQRLRLVYVLKKQVRIKPRLGLFSQWRLTGRPMAVKGVNLAIKATLEGKRLAGRVPDRPPRKFSA